jgi:hypothetical protein
LNMRVRRTNTGEMRVKSHLSVCGRAVPPPPAFHIKKDIYPVAMSRRYSLPLTADQVALISTY